MKAFVLAAALLVPTLAMAQAPEPADQAPPADAAPAAPAAKPGRPATARPAPARAAKPAAATTPEVLEVTQIIGIRQIDQTTYEIDARLQNGRELHLRANAFVLQSLGQQLGTYGR